MLVLRRKIGESIQIGDWKLTIQEILRDEGGRAVLRLRGPGSGKLRAYLGLNESVEIYAGGERGTRIVLVSLQDMSCREETRSARIGIDAPKCVVVSRMELVAISEPVGVGGGQ